MVDLDLHPAPNWDSIEENEDRACDLGYDYDWLASDDSETVWSCAISPFCSNTSRIIFYCGLHVEVEHSLHDGNGCEHDRLHASKEADDEADLLEHMRAASAEHGRLDVRTPAEDAGRG